MQKKRQKWKNLRLCGPCEPTQNAYQFPGVQNLRMQGVHEGGSQGKGGTHEKRVL